MHELEPPKSWYFTPQIKLNPISVNALSINQQALHNDVQGVNNKILVVRDLTH